MGGQHRNQTSIARETLRILHPDIRFATEDLGTSLHVRPLWTLRCGYPNVLGIAGMNGKAVQVRRWFQTLAGVDPGISTVRAFGKAPSRSQYCVAEGRVEASRSKRMGEQNVCIHGAIWQPVLEGPAAIAGANHGASLDSQMHATVAGVGYALDMVSPRPWRKGPATAGRQVESGDEFERVAMIGGTV
jgi:hypothetical protein